MKVYLKRKKRRINMKKNYYQEQKLANIIIELAISLLFLFTFIEIIITFDKTSNLVGGPVLLIIDLVVLLCIGLIPLFDSIGKIKGRHICSTVLKNGKKVSGTITKLYKNEEDSRDGYLSHFYVRIKYKDPEKKKDKEFKTKRLSFNPYRKLKSNKCNVYVYNDKVVATDFEFVESGEKGKYSEDEPKTPILSDIQIITLIVTICIIVFGFILLFIKLK
jgi:hypothetical protein